jgi:glycyl-tRNA synthetase
MSNTPSHNLKTISDFAKRTGFVYQGSEIYGGLANTWDYGPKGVLLKNNIKEAWRSHFLTERTDMVEVDAGIFMNPKVWEASGHVAGFADCMIDCKECKSRFRADHLIEEACDIDVEGWTPEQITTTINEKKINCPKCKAHNFTEARYMNLMFETNRDKLNTSTDIIERMIDEEKKVKSILYKYFDENPEEASKFINKKYAYSPDEIILEGIKKNIWDLPIEIREKEDLIHLQNPEEVKINCFAQGEKERILEQQKQGQIYLRPETAQGIFVNFKNVLQTERRKLPFGIGQIGKAFRNEITPGNFNFRVIEFEQMEIEYFIKPPANYEDAYPVFYELLELQKQFLTNAIGLNPDNLVEKVHGEDKLSHYSKKSSDWNYNYPFGSSELTGLAYRTDFDLKQHSKDFTTVKEPQSNTNLQYLDPETNEKYFPHCIEPTVGVDRLLLAVLCDFYTEEVLENDTRVLMKLPFNLAPYKIAVLPLMKKDGMSEKATEIFIGLRKQGVSCSYDEAGSIGKRYRRQDENGTPWCMCVDFTTLEDNTVTLRHRDTMEQVRVSLDEVSGFLSKEKFGR